MFIVQTISIFPLRLYVVHNPLKGHHTIYSTYPLCCKQVYHRITGMEWLPNTLLMIMHINLPKTRAYCTFPCFQYFQPKAQKRCYDLLPFLLSVFPISSFRALNCNFVSLICGNKCNNNLVHHLSQTWCSHILFTRIKYVTWNKMDSYNMTFSMSLGDQLWQYKNVLSASVFPCSMLLLSSCNRYIPDSSRNQFSWHLSFCAW